MGSAISSRLSASSSSSSSPCPSSSSSRNEITPQVVAVAELEGFADVVTRCVKSCYARRYSSSFSFLGRQTEVSPFLLLRLVSSSFSPGFLLKRRKKGWRGRETIRYTIVDRFSSSFSPSYSRHLSPRCPSFSPVSSPLLRVLSFSSSSFSSSIALSSSPQVSLSSCSFGSRNLHYLSSSRKSSSHTSPIASISRYHSTPLYHASVYTPYHSSSNSPDSPGTPSAIHQRQRNIFSPSSTLLSSPSSSSSSSLPFLPEISSSSSPFSLSLISSFSFSSSFSPLLIFPSSSSFLSSSSPLLLFPSSPSTSLLSPSSCSSSSFSLLCFYRSLFSKRSPGLKIPRLDRIYAMTPRELRNSVVDCARRHIYMKELWDAFLYRCVVLRSEFKPEQIAVILRSLSSLKRCPDQSFLDYMIEEIRMQVHLYRFQDLSLLFSALARLQIQDELLLRAFLPVILKRLSSSSSLSSKSISLFFHSYVRMNGPDLDVVASRVVSSLVGRLSSLREPQTLTLLLLSFSEHARKEVEKNLLISISFFHYQEKHEGKAKNNLLSSCTYTSDEHVGGKERRLFTPSSSMMLSDVPPITISFRLFLESLLEQVGKHLRDFRGQDTSATLSALTNLFACNRYLELYQAYVTENPHISQNDTRKKIKSSLSEDDGRDEDEGSDKDHFIQRTKQEEEEERLSGVYREGDSDWMMGREISPLLLNEILEKFLRRLTEVSFELQSQDLLTLFRSVHTLQELQHSYHYDPLIDFRGLLSSRRPFFLFNTNATISPIKFLHISSSLRRMYTRHKEDDRDEEGERQTRLSPERIEHADRLSRDQMSRRTTEGGKSRQQNAIERLESYLVKEIPYRVDSLDPHVAHELLLILSSQQHLPRSTGAQFYPGLEAALCVKLADTARTVFETSSFSSSSSSSSPHLRPSSSSPPPIGISWIETLCRLYAPATHPCLLPSFTLTSLSSSSSFGGPSFDSSLEESCEKGGILSSSSLFHSRQKNERRRGREIEQELRPYRFPLPVAQCFAEMFRKKSLPRLDAKTAASLCWACVAFRIKDSRLVEIPLMILMAASVFDLTHQRPQTLSNFLLKPPAQALYDKLFHCKLTVQEALTITIDSHS
ncbi:crn (crooked neck) related [Cystoisospora suis]|uniref:Crn (Crooked neck) related n=1 Tax=Cystoisospora suis TaxID=483139 RepID=A0A2C6KHH4_9APIC|nr:crn (crooked neck) related [Cystoisospora suis]